jgi:signal transduction histidine kinase
MARHPDASCTMPPAPRALISLQTALLVGLSGALLLGLLPAAVMLDRRMTAELARRAHDELLRAPMVLEDRNAARAEALAMHADVVAAAPGIADALRRNDRQSAIDIATIATEFPDEDPVVIAPDGDVWAGPPAASALARSQEPDIPVTFVATDGGPSAVAVSAVAGAPGFLAGVAAPLDGAAAAALGALTRSDVVVVTAASTVGAASGDSAVATDVAGLNPASLPGKTVHEVTVAGRPSWIVSATLQGAGAVVFVRSVDEELLVIPQMRRAVVLAALLALALAISTGMLFAMLLARPVRQLAGAAASLACGDFTAPLPTSVLTEVHQVGAAFDSMRAALAARLEELATANRALAERGERLQALQTELIQRDRLAASGRLVAELAHEIRNPVANVRNCIEVVRRRIVNDPEARAFADMAVEELLRMHRLAEQLLDLHRPADNGAEDCEAVSVLSQMAAFASAGSDRSAVRFVLEAPQSLPVAIPCDALKQILLNLIENAREAIGSGGTIVLRASETVGIGRIEVLDDGPGIPREVLPTLFDPFVTTKGGVSGVGLGLFVAEGIARRYGGRLRAENRPEGGARLVLDLLLLRVAGGAT